MAQAVASAAAGKSRSASLASPWSNARCGVRGNPKRGRLALSRRRPAVRTGKRLWHWGSGETGTGIVALRCAADRPRYATAMNGLADQEPELCLHSTLVVLAPRTLYVSLGPARVTPPPEARTACPFRGTSSLRG